MPSGNLQIVNASQEDEGTYKCAAYNPVTQEVKTSVSSERLRVRRTLLSFHCMSPSYQFQSREHIQSAILAGFWCELTLAAAEKTHFLQESCPGSAPRACVCSLGIAVPLQDLLLVMHE